MNKSNPSTEELFNFPCDYPIKVIGLDCPELKVAISAIIERHIGKSQPQQMHYKKSTKGRYISYTIRIIISSKQQIDSINQALQNCPLVAYIL